MCCGNIPRLCECGCSEYDHDEPSIEDKAFHTQLGGSEPTRGRCRGEKLMMIVQGMPEFAPCGCPKFKDAFEPEYTCRMP
jgi:hypothetical protein